MTTYPETTKTVFVGKLGREVTLHDLSVRYMDTAEKTEGYDNARNALVDATDLSEKEIDTLGIKTAQAIYRDIIGLTFGEERKDEGTESEKK